MWLDEALDDIGVGRYQWLQCLLLGGVMLVDAAEVMVCSSILGALETTWGLTPLMKGALMSTVFLGVFVGGLIGGHVADAIGRRPVSLMTYSGIIIFGIASAFCQGPESMIAFRFLLGACFGGGVSPIIALLVESMSKSAGEHFVNLAYMWWSLGEMYAAALLVGFMPNLTDETDRKWRQVVVLSVMPSAGMLLPMYLTLQESPVFLLLKGRREDAIAVLTFMANFNGRRDVIADLRDLEEQPSETTPLVPDQGAASSTAAGRQLDSGTFETPQQPSSNQWSLMFSREYRWTLVGCTYLCMNCNFVFYGMSYAFPQLFRMLHSTLGPAKQLFVVSLGCAPGVAFSSVLLTFKISHRDRNVLMIAVVACLELCMAMLSEDLSKHKFGEHHMCVAISLKAAANASMILVYVYLGMVFPPACRCTAVAFCIAGGRIGSIIAPMVFEEIMMHYGRSSVYFGLCTFTCIFAMLVIRFMLREVDGDGEGGASAGEAALPLQSSAAAAAASAAASRERRLSELSFEDTPPDRRRSVLSSTGSPITATRKRRPLVKQDASNHSSPADGAPSAPAESLS